MTKDEGNPKPETPASVRLRRDKRNKFQIPNSNFRHRRRSGIVFVLMVSAFVRVSLAVDRDEGWAKVKSRGALTVYNRSRSGSKVKELKAIGVIKAPPSAVRKAINDI